MKRSEVNANLVWAKNLLEKYNYRLPAQAYWDMEKWVESKDELDVIRRTMMGWDITDYGTGKFDEIGTVLYTVRNGLQDDPSCGVPYCEKFLLMRDGQRLPEHYHVSKTEDIINRAGGVMSLYLWNADPKTGKQLDTDVVVYMDGIKKTFKAGEEILVYQGQSVTLTPYMAHIFGAKKGTGDMIAGEVSKVNDDNTDNYFLEDTYRFSEIEEDEPILHPLCNEYNKVL